jgi:Fe-Mn family superoxide dismutase
MGDFFILPADLKTRLEGSEPPLILDVRKRAAFDESGHMLPGAIWRDPFAITQWIGDLANDRPLIVHCVHGHEVSQEAAQTLRDAGLNALVLTGGFEAWREAGFDVVPADENAGDQ